MFVVFEADTDYIKRCFEEYVVKTDPSGRYACLYKRWHLIGLEAGISVASIGLRGEPTGCPTGWRADAVAVAKRDLKMGEILDGEGGCTVDGRLMPSETNVRENCLPLGIAQGRSNDLPRLNLTPCYMGAMSLLTATRPAAHATGGEVPALLKFLSRLLPFR